MYMPFDLVILLLAVYPKYKISKWKLKKIYIYKIISNDKN